MSQAQASKAAPIADVLVQDSAVQGAAAGSGRLAGWRSLAHWNGIDALQASIRASSRFAESKMPALGMLCVVGHIVYFLIWTRVFPQAYESWGVRLAVVAVTVPILFIKAWPQSARRYLPLYWFVGITINLPAFFTYWAVMNQFNMITVTSHLASLFLILMVFDLRASLASFLLGFAVAAMAACIAGAPPLPAQELLQMLPVWAFVVVAATLFSLSRSIEYRARMDSVSATAATIAHELRTPLATIRLAATGGLRHLPAFVDSYRKARAGGLDVPLIQPAALRAIEQTGAALTAEVDHALVTIDMLLAASRPGQSQPLERLSAQDLVQSAVRRYPFGSSQERDKVYFGSLQDFIFMGSQPLLLNVIFNLLKNAIYHTSRVNKGDITLSLRRIGNHGEIVVQDSGPGIAPAFLPRIFERFSTSAVSSDIGLGIGLAFCKDAVERMHGDIRCDSVLGDYSRFVLRFPVAGHS